MRPAPDPQPHSRRFHRALAPAGAVALALAASVGSLRGTFVWDDLYNVPRNPWVREPGRVLEAFGGHLAAFNERFDTSFYRPVVHVLLAGVNAIFGLHPWAFHLLNVVLHATATLAVFVLVRRLTARREGGSSRSEAAPSALVPFLAAALFAVHPVHADAVAWVSGVMDLAAAAFGLFFLVAALSSVAWVRFAAAPLLLALALLSKEPAVTLLPVWLVAAWDRGRLLRDPGRRALLVQAGAFAAVLAGYLLLRTSALGGLLGGGARRVQVSGAEWFLTAVALWGEYLRMLVWPSGLSALHDFAVVRSAADPRFLVGVVATATLAGWGWAARRRPGAATGLALLVLPLLPALYVPVLGDGLVGERYLYTPSAGAALLLAASLPASAWSGRALRPAIALSAAIIAVLVGLSEARNRAWNEPLRLWGDATVKAPSSAPAHENLGYALLQERRFGEAAASFERALALEPDRTEVRVNLASTLAAEGALDRAWTEIDRALREQPNVAEAHAVVGFIANARGDLGTALQAYARAVELDPTVAATRAGYGIALARSGRLDLALGELREAVRLDPADPGHAQNLRVVEEAMR